MQQEKAPDNLDSRRLEDITNLLSSIGLKKEKFIENVKSLSEGSNNSSEDKKESFSNLRDFSYETQVSLRALDKWLEEKKKQLFIE